MMSINSKNILTTTFFIIVTTFMTGCNSTPEKTINVSANACEKGLGEVSRQIKLPEHSVSQVNISRANSLLLAARVQHQFAEYSGCLDKIQRAKDYLNGENSAIISKISFRAE